MEHTSGLKVLEKLQFFDIKISKLYVKLNSKLHYTYSVKPV